MNVSSSGFDRRSWLLPLLGSLNANANCQCALCLDICSPHTNTLDGVMPRVLHGPKAVQSSISYKVLGSFGRLTWGCQSGIGSAMGLREEPYAG